MSNLDKAISISSQFHEKQLDKSGQPYILHPLRIMFKFKNEEERIVAVMHDVIEDSEISLDYLKKEGFSDNIIEAIDSLTRRKNESYESFILRILPNELAKKIKIEDIKDNLDLTRLNQLTESDLFRVKKYHSALNKLLGSELVKNC